MEATEDITLEELHFKNFDMSMKFRAQTFVDYMTLNDWGFFIITYLAAHFFFFALKSLFFAFLLGQYFNEKYQKKYIFRLV